MKTRRKSSDAKDFILDAAEQALIEVGVNGLKIVHIAERANMRHTNIIYHFGSIDGVRIALMNRLIARHISDIMEIVKDVENKKGEEIISTPALVITRLFKMYSASYMPALMAWKLSQSHGKPIQEIELMVEAFIQLTTTKLTKLGLIEQAKRDNLLTIIHVGLSVCIGNMFLKSLWSENLTNQSTDESLLSVVIKIVTEMSGVENIKLNNGS